MVTLEHMNILLASKIISKSMGSERVFLLTQKWLKEFGVNGRLWTPEDTNLEKALEWANVLHWFNHGGSKSEWRDIFSLANKLNKPIVATATYWPLTQGELESGIKILDLTAEQVASLVETRLGIDRELAELLELADVIVATSPGELKQITGMMAYWNRKPKRFAVIPNVIDHEELPKWSPDWDQRPLQLVSVGRIEVAKNQPRVLVAFRRIKRRYPDASLVLIGRSEGVLEEKYSSLFKQDGVSLIGEVDFRVVSQILSQSRGHVLPSFRDTPGLASLEGAALGCNVVVSRNFGTPSDYFSNLAIYVDPLSEISIEEGMERALLERPDSKLQELVRSRFTYENIVPGLVKLYTMALKQWRDNNGSQG